LVSKKLSFLISRAFLWLRILKSFRGLNVKSQLNLLISSVIDILLSLVTTPSNPVLLFSGIYLVEQLNIIIYVRGRTDDLYHFLPGREGFVNDFIITILRPGDVFVDVGANVGYYTILGALRGSFVVAVEPIPTTVAVLKANLRLNGITNVVVIDKCAWFESTRVKLKIPHGSYYGLASAFYNRDSKYIAYEVECIDLDKVLEKFENVKLVKIDVEGAECEVLKGMEKSLDKVKYMIVEISRNIREVVDLLLKHRFKVKRSGFTTCILACRGNEYG